MAARGGVLADRWWVAVNAAERVIRWSAVPVVVAAAAVAAVVSFEHASALIVRTLTQGPS
jgi:hypothetical protein